MPSTRNVFLLDNEGEPINTRKSLTGKKKKSSKGGKKENWKILKLEEVLRAK